MKRMLVALGLAATFAACGSDSTTAPSNNQNVAVFTVNMLASNEVPPPDNSKTTPHPMELSTLLSIAVFKKLGKSTVLTQNLDFYPNLQNTGEYRFTFNLGTVTKLNKWFGWQNQFGDIYVSNPPTSSKKNDVIFTTGLNIAFTH